MPNSIHIPDLRVLLLDDHEIFCQGLQELFFQLNGKPCLAYVTTVEKCKEALSANAYSFLLCDVLIPNSDTKSFISYCRSTYPDLLIIMISTVIDVSTMKDFFKLGVNGYLSKSINIRELKTAFENVSAGKKYISADLNSRFTSSQLFINLTDKKNLSKKELEIIRLTATGKTVVEMAKVLSISRHTVISHRRNIMKKLNLHSGIEIVKYAYENNLT